MSEASWIPDLLAFLRFFLVSFLAGLAGWPVTAFFFGSLSDRGYAVSKVFGWLVPVWFLFTLCTLGVLPLSSRSVFLVFGVWVLANMLFQWRRQPLPKFSVSWKPVLVTEFLFFAAFAFWAFAKGHDPVIRGIERFMDMGVLQSLFLADSLPVHDFWYAGHHLNFYYFGHVVAYAMAQTARLDPFTAFNLISAWMVPVCFLLSFRLGFDGLTLLVRRTSLPQRAAAGLLSAFVVTLAGPWHILLWFFRRARYLLIGGDFVTYWYPNPTRLMPGTITEMPFYSFLVSELHPYVWGFMNGLLVVAALLVLWKRQNSDPVHGLPVRERDVWRFRSPGFFLLAFLLGISYMTNSWDALTLGTLSMTVLVFRFRRRLLSSLTGLLLLAPAAYAAGLPWSLFFHLPVDGLGWVQNRSPVLLWLSFWGGVLLVPVLFWVVAGMKKRKTCPDSREAERNGFYFFGAMSLTVLFFLAFMETVYIRDLLRDGDWYRTNTVFKITSQLWIWLGVMAGPMAAWVLLVSRGFLRLLAGILIGLNLLGQMVYPLKAIPQARFEWRRFEGFGEEPSIRWWKDLYPHDYEAYRFLSGIRDSLPEGDRVRSLVESCGDSFTDTCMFSVFLGWPTIVGWPVHVWTYRGTYEIVGHRVNDIGEIYIGRDAGTARELIERYGIDYIITGEAEKKKYGDALNPEKIRGLGEVVFENEQTFIVAPARAGGDVA